jgi:L-lactate utilization protein LutC
MPDETPYEQDSLSVDERAGLVRSEMEARADDLFVELGESAAQIGWTVARSGSPEDAGRYIEALARDLEAGSAVRSAHSVLDRLGLEGRLARSGIELGVMAVDWEGDEHELDRRRHALREKAIVADLGITGVDYAIAETGSCVLLARRGVSRLVSLLPPVHVAVVERGQVVPSLDELFVLYRHSILRGEGEGYMNIISGPSRSADIDQTLVTGVHGPGQVHLLLLG